MHSSASEAKDSWTFWSKVPGQAPLPQLKVAQQREVSHTFFQLAQQYSALQEEECLHVQPINTPLEYCRHVTHDVFWLKVKRRSETSKPRFHQTFNTSWQRKGLVNPSSLKVLFPVVSYSIFLTL